MKSIRTKWGLLERKNKRERKKERKNEICMNEKRWWKIGKIQVEQWKRNKRKKKDSYRMEEWKKGENDNERKRMEKKR